ncbi:UBX domain-containing protein 10-like [Acanthaster planci]|uniref:UBX domain-containing protein 10-like n=1 Tax=Acanthaster planci TaxID=133434 RepID=A0A8B7YA43_ACAPL|nr:UBX domain-containing protein 10-like [Acanthaster planci]
MISSLVNKNSFKMADAGPVDCEWKQRPKSHFKTKIPHIEVVADALFSRNVVKERLGSNQAMQKNTKKSASASRHLPSPPVASKRSSEQTRNVCQTESRDQQQALAVSSSTTMRPGSTLSIYSPLPGIGQSGHETEITAGILDLGLNERDFARNSPFSDSGVTHPTRSPESDRHTCTSGEAVLPDAQMKRSLSQSSGMANTNKISRREMRSQQFARRRQSQKSLAHEPCEGEDRCLIAVKLPEGERLQRYFRPSDSIADIVSYAEHTTRRVFSDCNVFTSDVPKRMVSNLSSTISKVGLGHRTLLYLEEKDE